MIKYFLRKTVYKGYDKRSQDMLYYLTSKQYIIKMVCYLFWMLIYIFPFVPLFIIDICEDVKFSMTTHIAIAVLLLAWVFIFVVLLTSFKKVTFAFSELLAIKTCFMLCTKKGEAIRKEDFSTIMHVDQKLYTLILAQECRGLCYSVCFGICKALKKGSIEILAIKDFDRTDKECAEQKKYTMHVLYVNSGWAFDTFSSCQYPLEKLHEIYKARIYRTFSYDELCNKSYQEFKTEIEVELVKWANAHDCSVFF